MKLIAPLCLIAVPVAAAACPPVPDQSVRIAELVAELKAAESQEAAAPVNAALWELWLDAPDEIAQAMLDEGMARRSNFDFLGARRALDRLVEYCPDYAEGYNQRAFASYLARDLEAALVDLDRTLEILPTHIGALSGKALTLIGLGRNDDAQDVLRAALALNPWLQERALLVEPDGTDL
ncbi:tetratricopeptide repeat protein [Yoonia sp.]|uniref:tetratricopeptide repeat protein n=1 Tax=Yoonia sp. TaxID=2212373 RepID=UPI0035C8622D